MNGSAEGRPLPNRNPPVIHEENTMKKIEIRKTGAVRLTSAAHPLYGGICGIRVA
jgi:hypothetical protein